MAGLNLNIGSSVVKRETRPLEEISQQLREDGWTQTGSIGERILYFEKSGINITVMKGAMATLVFPSGPIRGRVFGDSGLMFGRASVIGTGRVEGETGAQKRNAERINNAMT